MESRDSLDIFEMVKSITNVQSVAYREGFKAGIRAALTGQMLCCHCQEPVPADSMFRSMCDACRIAADLVPDEPGEDRDFPRPESL